MAFTLTTSGAATIKAGANASTDITQSGAAMKLLSELSEGVIEATTRRSWVANFSSLDTGIKGILNDVSSSLMAIQIRKHDPSKFIFSSEVVHMDNVDTDVIDKGLRVLRDFKSNTLKTP